MNENKLPMFKPSRLGLSHDLKSINFEQQRGAGWWKGQLSKYFDLLSTKVIVEGVECYDSSISLGSDSCYEPSVPAYIYEDLVIHSSLYADYIANINLITDGSFSFVSGGVYREVNGLNFSNATSPEDVAEIILAFLNYLYTSFNFTGVSGYIPELDSIGMTYKLYGNVPGVYSTIDSFGPSSEGTFIGEYIFPTGGTIVAGVDATDNDVISFLELFGVEEEGFTELCDVYNSSAVSNVKFEFKEKFTFEQVDFDYIFSEINNEMINVNRVTIEYSEIYLLANEPATITTSKKARFPDLYGSMLDEGRPSVTMLDLSQVDITSQITTEVVTAIGSMLFCSSTSLYQFDGVAEVIRNYYNDGVNDYVEVVINEGYSTPFSSSFNDEYSSYESADRYIYDIDDSTLYEYVDNYANDFWKVRDSFAVIDGPADKDGLFIRSAGKIYLSVEGLSSTNANDVAYYLSQYSEFVIIKSSVAWYKKIINTFIGLIVGIINAISAIAISLPVLRQIIQSIIWIFNGQEWVTDDDKLIQYTSVVTIAVISILYTILTSDTKGGLSMFEYLSIALSATSMGLSIGEIHEKIETNVQLEEIQRLEKELEENEAEDIEPEMEVFGANNQFLVLERMIDEQGYDSFDTYDEIFETQY